MLHTTGMPIRHPLPVLRSAPGSRVECGRSAPPAPYRDIREELKAAADVTEVYVHTTETRGREEKHASDYEAPLTDFIDIDTTGKSVEESLQEVIAAL